MIAYSRPRLSCSSLKSLNCSTLSALSLEICLNCASTIGIWDRSSSPTLVNMPFSPVQPSKSWVLLSILPWDLFPITPRAQLWKRSSRDHRTFKTRTTLRRSATLETQIPSAWVTSTTCLALSVISPVSSHSSKPWPSRITTWRRHLALKSTWYPQRIRMKQSSRCLPPKPSLVSTTFPQMSSCLLSPPNARSPFRTRSTCSWVLGSTKTRRPVRVWTTLSIFRGRSASWDLL